MLRALGGTVVGNAPGFVYPFLVSAVFGVGGLTDGYFLAFATSVFVASIANVAVESNALPAAHDARLRGRPEIFRFAARTSVQVVLAGLLVYAVVGAGVAAVSTPGQPVAAHVFRECLIWFAIYVGATSACSVVTACMYAHDQFFAPSASGSVRAIAAIATLAFVGSSASALPILAAAWSLGEVLRLVLLSAMLFHHASAKPSGTERLARSVWRPLITHAVSMCVVGAVPLIDRAFASTLAPGSVTILELGEKVLFVPVLVFTSSITVVAGTRWAEAAGEGIYPLDDARRVFRSLAIMSTAVAAALIACAFCVAAVFPRMLDADSLLLASVVAALCVGIPSAVLVNATIRFLTATGRTKILPLFAVLTLGGNTAMDALGVWLFGLPGIVVATTMVRAISLALYWRYVTRSTTLDSPTTRNVTVNRVESALLVAAGEE